MLDRSRARRMHWQGLRIPMLRAAAVTALAASWSAISGAAVASQASGELCVAPFHAKASPSTLPGQPPPPPSPSEPSLSETTWEPGHDSHFTFYVDGVKRATVGDGEMAHLTSLPTDRKIRVRVQLDGRPFEAFSLDLSRYDHRICLWLYPSYWHWIDLGWEPELGCKCGAGARATPTPPPRAASPSATPQRASSSAHLRQDKSLRAARGSRRR
jgi:hypothetical protein